MLTFARDELLWHVKRARERVWLTSPFLTVEIAGRIVKACDDSGVEDRRLLTALVPGSVQIGVLDPAALRLLHEGGFTIGSIANLHAKVSLIDSSWGLVGSGNLTNAGLGSNDHSNVELGVVLSHAQIQVAERLFARWWEEAKRVSAAVIEEFAALPHIDRRRAEIGDFGPALELPQTKGLEQILAESDAVANLRHYWIKSNYHNPDDPRWWHRNWISDWRKAPFEVGDVIVLYLSARDGGPGICPATVRATTRSRLDRKWVIEHRDEAAAERWPFVTQTTFVAEVPIADGVPLSVVKKSGQSVQGGYCGITRSQFERIAREMLSVAPAGS